MVLCVTVISIPESELEPTPEYKGSVIEEKSDNANEEMLLPSDGLEQEKSAASKRK